MYVSGSLSDNSWDPRPENENDQRGKNSLSITHFQNLYPIPRNRTSLIKRRDDGLFDIIKEGTVLRTEPFHPGLTSITILMLQTSSHHRLIPVALRAGY